MQRTLIASLDKSNLDKEVSVSGWVENIRDHGGVIFIDLREGLDIFQIVIEPQNKEIFSIAETIRNEYVIQLITENIIRGKSEGLYRDNINPDIIARVYSSNILAIVEGQLIDGNQFKHGEVYIEFLRFLMRGLTSDRGI